MRRRERKRSPQGETRPPVDRSFERTGLPRHPIRPRPTACSTLPGSGTRLVCSQPQSLGRVAQTPVESSERHMESSGEFRVRGIVGRQAVATSEVEHIEP
jgi:hypothetical protein